jgi:hypothetical protein
MAVMEYEPLLAAAKQDPAAADFTQLRLAFSRSGRYDPSAGRVLDEDDGLDAALSACAWREARQLAESALARNYVRLHPHICAALACCQLEDVPGARHHKAFVKGVLESIMHSGDGSTPETALRVIAVWEETDVLRCLSLRCVERVLCREGERVLDCLRVQTDEGSEAFDLYFDMTIPMAVYGSA